MPYIGCRLLENKIFREKRGGPFFWVNGRKPLKGRDRCEALRNR